ncbi:hypothetical protein JCM10207_001274 [Rhodosporidiobolus poonsookiae]
MQPDSTTPSQPPPPPGGAPPPPSSSSSSRPTPLSRRSHAPAPSTSNPQWARWDKLATDLGTDWIDEQDMDAFASALADEPAAAFDELPTSPTDGTVSPGGEARAGVEKIRAVSDFAPIKEKVRRSGKRRKDVVREGWAYHVSRWPLLLLIFTIIFLEFICYLVVRQMVNVIEFFSSWRGERGRLRLALRNAKTYEEWKTHALALDAHLGLNDWKRSPSSSYYDAPLVRRVLRALRDLRGKDDAEGVAAVLHAVLRSNFAGVEGTRLYSESYYGTKELVQEYVDEVTRSLTYLRSSPPSALPPEDKADFFRSVAKNLGASALCLSGGASFGYYHFGVVRALLDEGLIPRVVTGTSAGAIVAALLCTRTNPELETLLVPSLADRITACSEPFAVWAKRAWRTGARFDTVQWARKASFFTMGSMTFREAYERTGRVLNVSVIPYDTHSPTKLLNYLTAPDCVIWSAVIASAAVPGIINPVVLMVKDKNGELHPWEFQGKHKDGSLRVDIPLHSLHLLYNVNFSIVSQSNPHLHLFFFSPRGSPGRPVAHRKGKGWRGGFWLSAAEQFWKIEMVKWFKVIRDLELMPEFGGQNWSAVFLQKFEGTVTISPKSRFVDWFRILTDPDQDELARMIKVGQQVTWPKIKMIENRLKMERQIDLGRDELRAQLASSSAAQPSTANGTIGSTLHPPPFLKRRSSSSSIVRLHAPAATQDATASSDEDEDEDDELEGEDDPLTASEAAALDAPSSAQHPKEQQGTPAKRRAALLAKLGLGRVAGRGARDSESTALGGQEQRGAMGGGGESDWTSGGEHDHEHEHEFDGDGGGDGRSTWAGARGAGGGGDGPRRRRRFSVSGVVGRTGRERAATIGSSDDEGRAWERWR